jgi:hypothetical protein
MSWLRPTYSGNGPWVVALSCCGRDQGTQRCPTWQAADEFRESYVDAGGHDRSAIIIAGPEDHLEELWSFA